MKHKAVKSNQGPGAEAATAIPRNGTFKMDGTKWPIAVR